MMAKTGICSIVVIATPRMSFSHFTKKLNQEFSLFQTITSSKMKGVRTCFTDAVLVDGKIYFLATAENTAYAYDDGEILGSLGRIDIETMKIDFTKKLAHK
jgi:hypothetical protein